MSVSSRRHQTASKIATRYDAPLLASVPYQTSPNAHTIQISLPRTLGVHK